MQEKRRHPRRPIRLPVRIFPKNGQPALVETADLSVGGMLLTGPAGVAFGEEIEVELDLPTLGPTRLPAIVRWLRTDGFGVQFGLLGAVHTHALADLVQHTPTVEELAGPRGPRPRALHHTAPLTRGRRCTSC